MTFSAQNTSPTKETTGTFEKPGITTVLPVNRSAHTGTGTFDVKFDTSRVAELKSLSTNVTGVSDKFYGGGSFQVLYDYRANPVPEPETYALFLAGLVGVAAYVRRRQPRA